MKCFRAPGLHHGRERVRLEGEAGRNDRSTFAPDIGCRGAMRRRVDRILIVDPVPSSRGDLAAVLSDPGRVLAIADGIPGALESIRRAPPALILVSRELGEEDGLTFLRQLRGSHPRIERVLVTERGNGAEIRRAITQADLAFVVRKPWHPESLRQTVHDFLAAGARDASRWRTLPASPPTDTDTATAAGLVRPLPVRADAAASWRAVRPLESLSRDLLTRLNSCERETEILRLLHVELAAVCPLSRWLWVGENPHRAMRISGPPPEGVDLVDTRLDTEQWNALQQIHDRLEGNPLDPLVRAGREQGESVVGITVLLGCHGRLRGLVWADRRAVDFLTPILRELQPGLQNALCRVRDTESRARAASWLARRVAEDLRGPAGALAHAVERLRREAEHSGNPSVWLEQLSAESRRVVEAVAHFERDLISERMHGVAS